MSASVKNLVGLSFGRLMVIQFSRKDNFGKMMWECKCACGTLKVIVGCDLTRGTTRSCGCLARELSSQRRRKHGCGISGNQAPEYKSWISMRQRCCNQNDEHYPSYGGRGIQVCDRWRESFENFLQDMGPRPYTKTIGRIDNDGNYEPSNCQWQDSAEQSGNKRNSKLITFNGETACLARMAEKHNIPKGIAKQRISRGWSIERALSTPPRRYACL